MSKISYIDESGTPSLETEIESVGPYFIVSAVIIDSNDEKEITDIVSYVRHKEFSDNEIKSSNIGKDLDRRKRVLKAILKGQFSTHTICIDKRRIDKNSGLIYKRPFLKYVNGLLYRKLLKSFTSLKVFFDEHGSKEFQDSFVRYIDEYHKTSLFNTSEIIPAKSHEVPGIQIADLFAGSMFHFIKNRDEEIWNLLKEKSICIDIWPPERKLFHSTNKADSSYDQVIEDYCLKQAEIYLENSNNEENPDEKVRDSVVEYLLFRHLSSDNNDFVYTKEIMEKVLDQSYEMSEQLFRSKIIGKLRDSEVIIASSPKGLKIPSSIDDLSGFVEESMKKIIPMLKRINSARKQIKYVTMGKLDIVGNYDTERKILDSFEDEKPSY